MEQIIEKLERVEDYKTITKKWSRDEIQRLLELYYAISQKEDIIFKLIYHYHGCDSWEDIFRDYDLQYLEDKAVGVKIALDYVSEQAKNK